MNVANRVRRIYERRPYPSPTLRKAPSSLPPIEWIKTLWGRPASYAPARILVAGCGVGTEAFRFAHLFREAEVVGVDFSPRSIATAVRLQRHTADGDRVRFEVADISSAGLKDLTGGSFDLVSCHGVLSYVTEPVGVLRNLARCLRSTGVLVLGVNGEAHPSQRWRRALSDFGIEPEEFREGRRVRGVLRVFESLSFYPPARLADHDAGFLAGDLFGPLNRALPLQTWSDYCREAGLHVLGSYHAYFAIRALLNRDLYSLLIPRSRTEVAELVDALQPGSFHQLVLSRRRPAEPPWSEGRKLLRWRPLLTPLYKIRWPPRGGPWHQLRSLTLESPPTGTKVSLRIPRWEVEILRESDGERSLGEILRVVKPSVSAKALSEAMYLLYQLAAVNLLM